MSSSPGPLSLLREGLLTALEAEYGSAYLLGRDLSVQYVNQAWRRFARENGAPELGGRWNSAEPITRYFDEPLRELLAARFTRVLTRNEPWSYQYDCSSPEVYRKLNMRVAPTAPCDGLIVVHSRVVDVAPGATESALDNLARIYTDARGLIVQCSGCQRVCHPAESSWDWAPGLVTDEQENVSHGICPTCEFQYYGQ
jgi:hypothetical protein